MRWCRRRQVERAQNIVRGPVPLFAPADAPQDLTWRVWCEVRFRPCCGACKFWSGETATRKVEVEQGPDGVWFRTGREANPWMVAGPQPRCQRYAPELPPKPHANRDEGWPVTYADDWCGEFEARGQL